MTDVLSPEYQKQRRPTIWYSDEAQRPVHHQFSRGHYGAIANSQTLQVTTSSTNSSLPIEFTGCLMTASNAATSSFVFTNLLAGDCLTIHSALLCNNLTRIEALPSPTPPRRLRRPLSSQLSLICYTSLRLGPLAFPVFSFSTCRLLPSRKIELASWFVSPTLNFVIS